MGAPPFGGHVLLTVKFRRDPAESPRGMGSFLRAFYLVMFALPAVLLLAGLPGASTREDVAVDAQSSESTLVGREWRVKRFGLSLHVPEGWAWMSTGTRESVCLDPNRRDRASISVIALPNAFGKTLHQLEAENIEALRAAPSIELDASRRLVVDGVDVLRFDYHGRQESLAVDMRYACLVWIASGRQVVLTVQLDAERWEVQREGLEEALASLSLRG